MQVPWCWVLTRWYCSQRSVGQSCVVLQIHSLDLSCRFLHFLTLSSVPLLIYSAFIFSLFDSCLLSLLLLCSLSSFHIVCSAFLVCRLCVAVLPFASDCKDIKTVIYFYTLETIDSSTLMSRNQIRSDISMLVCSLDEFGRITCLPPHIRRPNDVVKYKLWHWLWTKSRPFPSPTHTPHSIYKVIPLPFPFSHPT